MHFTQTTRNGFAHELRGILALMLIAMAILVAFAVSPLATLAALAVIPAVYMHQADRPGESRQALVVRRLSLGLAVIGTVALLIRFA